MYIISLRREQEGKTILTYFNKAVQFLEHQIQLRVFYVVIKNHLGLIFWTGKL